MSQHGIVPPELMKANRTSPELIKFNGLNLGMYQNLNLSSEVSLKCNVQV